MECNWPYFVGFGLPLAVLTSLAPSFIIRSVLATSVPLIVEAGNLVITALITEGDKNSAGKHILGAYTGWKKVEKMYRAKSAGKHGPGRQARKNVYQVKSAGKRLPVKNTGKTCNLVKNAGKHVLGGK